ncbi:LURP-one-related/scramblase family protein [Haloplanus natans]|uniref:LURP-one-related/scramblase family protein n=1 Tax=Haloplanus natans TaxID=376171 RepID=UPI000677F8DB|nr:LURP-one-related family protein [Haloplanus natans]
MSVDDGGFSAIELRGNRYTVEQSLIRNKYAAYDENGTLVLRAKQKLFKLKEEFPFVDADGNEVFTVKAGGVLDIAGNYAIVDAETGKRVAILDNDYSLLRDTWTIRDGETEAALAKITSRGAVVTLARNLLPFGELIPHKYEITDAQGGHVGRIDGQLSLRDTYDITIDDAGDVPRDAVVVAAMVIDAIQGN